MRIPCNTLVRILLSLWYSVCLVLFMLLRSRCLLSLSLHFHLLCRQLLHTSKELIFRDDCSIFSRSKLSAHIVPDWVSFRMFRVMVIRCSVEEFLDSLPCYHILIFICKLSECHFQVLARKLHASIQSGGNELWVLNIAVLVRVNLIEKLANILDINQFERFLNQFGLFKLLSVYFAIFILVYLHK